MTTITAKMAVAMATNDQAIIVDVREPAEFWEGHLPTAINLPSTKFRVESYHEFADRAICLVCRTGRRAGRIAEKLKEEGFSTVFLLEQQMATLEGTEIRAAGTNAGWTIDRQFNLTLGVLLVTFLLGYCLWSVAFLVIPLIMSIGLINAAITDNCYLRMGIAMLPWNRSNACDMSAQNAFYHTA